MSPRSGLRRFFLKVAGGFQNREIVARDVRVRAAGLDQGSALLAPGSFVLQECTDLHGARPSEESDGGPSLRAETTWIPDFGKVRIHQRLFGTVYTRGTQTENFFEKVFE